MPLTLPIMDMSGLEWTPDVSIYRQPWRENTGACLQAPAEEGVRMDRLVCSDPPEESCSDTGCPVHGGDDMEDVKYVHHLRDPEGDEAAHA